MVNTYAKKNQKKIMRLAVCNKCKKVFEYLPETKYEGGTSYSIVICPHCKNEKKNSTNHIHYGDDGKR